MYVLHSTIIAYVPNNSVKIVRTQPDTDGRRGRWITQILEYDLTIKTTKLVKGQGLTKLLAESNCKVLGINSVLQTLVENPQEPSQNSNEKNPKEPFVYAEGRIHKNLPCILKKRIHKNLYLQIRPFLYILMRNFCYQIGIKIL